jgi:hypothetical protein
MIPITRRPEEETLEMTANVLDGSRTVAVHT